MSSKSKKKNENETKRVVYKYALVEIPSDYLPRFVEIPSNDNKKYIIFLDDIIRYKIDKIFEAYDIVDCYSIKLTRDAELYIEDEYSGDLQSKILSGISRFIPPSSTIEAALSSVHWYRKLRYHQKSQKLVKGSCD